jgi:putative transposase
MWDITWLRCPVKGMYFYLYLVIDLYSRKVVAWEIKTEESAEHASQLIRRAVISEKINPNQEPLILHSDNGSPMKGSTLLQTLYALGIEPSYSRPRVSNDNPYAESIFRTCKYRPNFPTKGLASLQEARKWVLAFIKLMNSPLWIGVKVSYTPSTTHCFFTVDS